MYFYQKLLSVLLQRKTAVCVRLSDLLELEIAPGIIDAYLKSFYSPLLSGLEWSLEWKIIHDCLCINIKVVIEGEKGASVTPQLERLFEEHNKNLNGFVFFYLGFSKSLGSLLYDHRKKKTKSLR